VVYATDGTITTNLADAGTTVTHLGTVFDAAAAGEAVTFGFTADGLTSQGLPTRPVTGGSLPGQPYEASPATMAWIGAIEQMSIVMAANFDPAQDVRDRLTGRPRGVHRLAEAIWIESEAAFPGQINDVRVLLGTFGLHGALPMLAVWYEEGYFLVDATTGLADGPYPDGVAYNPVNLLLQHEPSYTPGTDVGTQEWFYDDNVLHD
jgi:hypothetical protein